MSSRSPIKPKVISTLPLEILCAIANFVAPADFIAMRATCCDLRDLLAPLSIVFRQGGREFRHGVYMRKEKGGFEWREYVYGRRVRLGYECRGLNYVITEYTAHGVRAKYVYNDGVGMFGAYRGGKIYRAIKLLTPNAGHNLRFDGAVRRHGDDLFQLSMAALGPREMAATLVDVYTERLSDLRETNEYVVTMYFANTICLYMLVRDAAPVNCVFGGHDTHVYLSKADTRLVFEEHKTINQRVDIRSTKFWSLLESPLGATACKK